MREDPDHRNARLDADEQDRLADEREADRADDHAPAPTAPGLATMTDAAFEDRWADMRARRTYGHGPSVIAILDRNRG